MAGQQTIRSSSRDLALIQHAEKSDDELQQIVVNNSRIIRGLPQTQSGNLEAEKLLGEAEGCNEILSRRRNARLEAENKQKEWKANAEKRKIDALLNLRAALTPNGQLVQAILEDEESLSQEELSGWCDELGMLEDGELAKLLEDLTADGVLYVSDDKRYSLRVLCENDLTWDKKYVHKVLDKNASSWKEELMALYDLVEFLGPVCSTDFLAYENKLVLEEIFRRYGLKPENSIITNVTLLLRILSSIEGLIKNAYYAGNHAYYVTTLVGEGGNK